MKKLLSLAIVLVMMAGLLVGCNTTIEDEYNPAQSQPQEEAVDLGLRFDPNSNFASTYAKTATHLFFVDIQQIIERDDNGEAVGSRTYHYLYRTSLNNITQRQRIAVPSAGEIEIVGLTDDYLFISVNVQNSYDWTDRTFSIYRVALTDFAPTQITTGNFFGAPRFHNASGYLLTAFVPTVQNESGHTISGGIVQLNAVDLQTQESTMFFEFESEYFLDGSWTSVTDDGLIFMNRAWGAGSGDWVHINKNLNAYVITEGRDSIFIDSMANYGLPPALTGIFSERNINMHEWVQAGEIVYFIDRVFAEGDSSTRSLYSVNVDGSNMGLIEENTALREIYTFNNYIFATIGTGCGYDSEWVQAAILNENFESTITFGAGFSGHNAAFFTFNLQNSNLIFAYQGSFFGRGTHIVGIFCTESGETLIMGELECQGCWNCREEN